MKKLMWILSFISLAGTAFVLQYMPDSVPMHYDMSGNIDRWGSKYENMIFPIIILIMALFWTLFIRYYDSKVKCKGNRYCRVVYIRNVYCYAGIHPVWLLYRSRFRSSSGNCGYRQGYLHSDGNPFHRNRELHDKDAYQQQCGRAGTLEQV